MRSRIMAAVIALLTIFAPLIPVLADVPSINKSVTITGTSVDVTVQGLSGQSSCTVEINGTASGTTQGLVQGLWVNVNSVQIPDQNSAPSPTVSGPGQFTANCAGMQAFRFHPSAVTGSVLITIIANSAVGRIIGAGVNGGRTLLAGAAPITVTNSGATATVALSPLPIPLLYGGTGATALPSGCLQSNGTVVASTGNACGSGTVTAVTGTGNINVTAGATPVVSITASPIFAGTLGVGHTVTVGTAGSEGSANNAFITMGTSTSGSGVEYITNSVSGASNVQGIAGTQFQLNDGTNNHMALDDAGNVGFKGAVSASQFNGSGSGLTSATVPNAALVTAPVTSVAGTGNITSTGGTTPTVSITAAPTFTTVASSTLNGSSCLDANGSSVVISAPAACPVNKTGATFVLPALGGSVSVSVSNNPGYFPAKNNTPIIIADGTNTMSGVVTAGATTGTLTVTNMGVIAGAVGNTMANNAYITAGGAGPSMILNYQAGTRLNGMHKESSAAAGISVGATTTATFTYGSSYAAAPTCVVGTIGNVAPSMSLNATPGISSAVIFNSSGSSGTASISCSGW